MSSSSEGTPGELLLLDPTQMLALLCFSMLAALGALLSQGPTGLSCKLPVKLEAFGLLLLGAGPDHYLEKM